MHKNREGKDWKPDYIQTICDSCSELVQVKVDFIVRLDDGISYQGLICPRCGNVLILDNLALQFFMLPRAKGNKPTPHSKKTAKRKWKIINKGKLPPDASTSGNTTAPRKT